MKTQLLLVVGLLFILPNLFAQENFFQENHLKESFLSQRKQYLPHVQINEMGYHYVDMDFIHPNDDRSEMPVLDSSVYTTVNTSGDTIYRRTEYYTISPDNRLQRIEYEEYDTYGTVEVKKSYSEYFYEIHEDSIVQRTTVYVYNENGQADSSENYILVLNNEGLILTSIWQFYVDGEWVNFIQDRIEYNDFNCPISTKTYGWENNAWYINYRQIGDCEDELLLKETIYQYNELGENEINTGYQDYEYDENNKLISRTVFSVSIESPGIIAENYLYLYNYNEEGLRESVEYLDYDHELKEFYNEYFYSLEYDELHNRIKTEYFGYDNSNMLKLRSQTFTVFDNNYLKGEFLNGNVFSTSKSMQLRYTWYPLGANSHDTQYFYSTGSVSSTEQTSKINFEIFPNPTSGELNIKFTDLVVPNSNIIVRNSTGAVIMRQIADGVNNINVGYLPSGMYFISVEGSDSRSEIKKFVKL